uniref:Uncharacterized protein n=2 Tax=Emiliania huxleyi TaxID=2903 RepID=A0A6U8MUW8_EMIHU
MLCRDASKPGRAATVDGGALWTAVSTPQLARAMAGSAEAGAGLRRREGPRADAAAAKLLSEEVSLLLAPFLGGEHLRPLSATATLWSDASAADSLHHPHECVSLPAWRLAIAGEFVKEAASPLEAAALSGLAAGEAVAAAL